MVEIRAILKKYIEVKNIKATARQYNISKNTLKVYLKRLRTSGYTLETIDYIDDSILETLIYNGATSTGRKRKERFDSQLSYFVKELSRKGVTRQLLWEEYKNKDPNGYSYSQFCEALRRHVRYSDLSLSIDHNPAETMMLDYAGAKIAYHDEYTGEHRTAEVLVAVLPYSQYTFAIALPSQSTEDFIYGITKALEYYGGTPKYMMSDNLKAYVIKADRYEPKYNELSVQLAQHYNMDMQATRVRKPKDKGSVENMVRTIYTRLYAPLRNKIFHSIDQINEAFAPLLESHNNKSFQNKEGSRSSIFDQEKSMLNELPSERFQVKRTTIAKVQKNYHILLGQDKQYYSVPYKYVGKEVTVIYTATTVDIYQSTQRIAIHQRLHNKENYRLITQEEHRPKPHQAYNKLSKYNAEDFIGQAKQVGQHTQWAIEHILTHQPNQDQAYKSCLGILSLANTQGKDRIEKACQRCKQTKHVNYTILRNILSKNLDSQTCDTQPFSAPVEHDNIRGAQCYQ